jgi:circadian clock protein KaiA
MSDHQKNHSSSGITTTKLQICLFSNQPQLGELIGKLLNGDRYELKCLDLMTDFTDFVVNNNNYEYIDCLILSLNDQLSSLLDQLWQSEILLPTVILEAESINGETENANDFAACLKDLEVSDIYHQAEVRLYPKQLKEINSYINLAINKFISLSSSSKTISYALNQIEPLTVPPKSLISQQRRLTDKLKERLGYLGFFYKRNPDSFWSNLSAAEQEKLTTQIAQSYRQILLLYFDQGSEINQLIDELVDRAFFANISTSQILEIHMDLMDDFAHQLKIEGRNDDILLDYRLPLIDIISHLCEIYRRSIPESDASINLWFTVE